jgi:hypothetical protein
MSFAKDVIFDICHITIVLMHDLSTTVLGVINLNLMPSHQETHGQFWPSEPGHVTSHSISSTLSRDGHACRRHTYSLALKSLCLTGLSQTYTCSVHISCPGHIGHPCLICLTELMSIPWHLVHGASHICSAQSRRKLSYQGNVWLARAHGVIKPSALAVS